MDRDGAVLIPDDRIVDTLGREVRSLLDDPEACRALSTAWPGPPGPMPPTAWSTSPLRPLPRHPRLMQDERLFFLGIGGIGMSALARWYRHHGATVAGHDRTETALTRALVEEGIPVDTSGDCSALPASLLADLDAGRTDRWTVIRTPAVPDDFPLLALLRNAGFPVLKRAELLGKLTAERPLLAVAGTHGKTTTSTLLAHLLHQDGTAVEAFLGGIARSTGSNLLLAEAAGKEGPRLGPWWKPTNSTAASHPAPTHAVITSADADHLDIYGTEQALHAAVVEFGRSRCGRAD